MVLADFALLALAGAIGTIARALIGGLSLRWFGDYFPWGTLIVNCLGCFCFGLIWTLADERQWVTREVRVVLLTGFMGAFTTFSAFAFETGRLVEEGRLLAASANVATEVLAGIFCLFLGFGLGRWL